MRQRDPRPIWKHLIVLRGLCCVSKMPELPWGQPSLNGERPHLRSWFPHPCLMQGLSCLSVGVSLSGEDGTGKAGTWATMWRWPPSAEELYVDHIALGRAWNTAFPVAMTPVVTIIIPRDSVKERVSSIIYTYMPLLMIASRSRAWAHQHRASLSKGLWLV